jgi:hypothetical protein
MQLRKPFKRYQSMTARKPRGGGAGQTPTRAQAAKAKGGAKKGNTNFIPFPIGNQLWKSRSIHSGPALKMASAELLWSSCCEYFEWNRDNPLWEMKAFAHQGAVTQEPVAKMRAMTIGAMCVFLDISNETWIDWRKNRDDLQPVIKQVEAIIYAQKFEGASADLLNASIIARDLGLADKRELSGPGGGPIQTINNDMTPQEAAEAYAATLDANKG